MANSLVINNPSIAPYYFSFFSSSSSSSSSSNLTVSSRRNLSLRNLRFHGIPSSSPLLYLSPTSVNSRGNYVASLSAHQSPPTSNSEEANSTDVKTLIRTYKQALIDGDEFAVSGIETVLFEIEKAKNKMDDKVLSLSMKIASEKERRIRLQADFDNTRKKLDKDNLSTESNSKVQIMRSLLPIIDSFERARLQIKPDSDKEKKIDTSYQGIYRQFVEVLRHFRVKAIATVGKPFDPLMHEAISREESEEGVKAGVITEELNRGFLLEERVLRPAKVKVSLGPIKTTKKTPPPPSSAAEETTTSA